MTTITRLMLIVRGADASSVYREDRQFLDQLGFRAGEVAERPLLDWIHPEDREALSVVIDRGEGEVLARHQTKAGDWVGLEWSVTTHEGDTLAMGVIEHSASFQSPAIPALTPTYPAMTGTLDAMARIIEGKNPGMRCSILLVDSAREYIIGGAGPNFPDRYNQALEGLRIGPEVGSCGTAVFWNSIVVVEDIATDPLWRHLQSEADMAGVSACWSHPIIDTRGEVLGAMALYADEPSGPTGAQLEGLAIAAQMAGCAIERDRMEERYRAATKMEAVGVLAGGVAHDFNNLLATIMGNAELAMESVGAQSEAVPLLEEIVTASTNASELCRQLLVHAGRNTVSTEAVECGGLIRDLAGLLRAGFSKKVRLSLALSREPVFVVADPIQVRRAILNLTKNSADAIGDNEGDVEVGTECREYTRGELESVHSTVTLEPGEYVRIWVRDTGAGMSAQTQSEVFVPFFTTKSDGHGLGLSAVMGIIESYRGGVVLESIPTVGTTFSMLFPRAEAPTDPSSDGVFDATPAHGECVLVVDDEPQVRRILGGILQRANYRVVLAADGHEAIDLFRADPDGFDCVLLDLSMPRLGGEEVFRELRKIREDVRVVLTSGFAEQEIIDRFRGMGLAGIIAKPARSKALLAAVANATRRKESQRSC